MVSLHPVQPAIGTITRDGAMFKFIHAADIHLDSPLLGLQRYAGAPVEMIRNATRQALENLVQLAIAEEAAFVLLAGDLYDGDWKDYNTGLFFASRMARLREAGIRVIGITGNHDADSQITRTLSLPENVTMLSTRRPETVRLEDIGVAIHGQGFSARHVADDLTGAFPPPDPHAFNIGLLHTSADGRPGHADYAPCTLQGLLDRGYDYWALGHIHAAEVLSRDPWVVFAGNTQGRHIRETGSKGCMLVTVENHRVTRAQPVELDVLRWAACEVTATAEMQPEDVLAHLQANLKRELDLADGRPLAARVRLRGPERACGVMVAREEQWTNEIRQAATDIGGGLIWLEQVRFEVMEEQAADEIADDALGGLVRSIQELATSDEEVRALGEEFTDLFTRLPREMQEGEDAPDAENLDYLRAAVEDARALLLAQLLHGRDPA